MRDQVQQLGNFGLEGMGMFAHRNRWLKMKKAWGTNRGE
jgi:hypothetical protein